MFVVKYRKIFYIISVLLVGGSIFATAFWGLRPGVDFSGGSLLSISFPQENIPTLEETKTILAGLDFKDASVRSSEEGYILRLREISQAEKDSIMTAIRSGGYSPIEKTFSSVGPVLGREAIHKSWISIVLVLLAIIFFIAFAFRKVSKPISSWTYGLVAIFALLHDVLVPTGVFALLGYLYGFEIDTLFVTAILVILGFSVHDTIVVFDRVRENLHKNDDGRKGESFENIVGKSISETFTRSLNTSITTLLAIAALYIWGPEAVRHFSLVLLIGIAVGTYSSIFVGSPLLVTINSLKHRK